MSFTIDSFKKEGLSFLKLQNNTTEEYVEVIPSLGGMVFQICLHAEGKNKEILREDSLDQLKENPLFRGRMLFPFNDRIEKATYVYQGTPYTLKSNCEEDGSAIHGFLYNQSLKVTSTKSDSDQAILELFFSSSSNEFAGYPFSIELTIKYILSHKGLRIEWDISNQSSQSIPMALGWHPYFKLGDSIKEATLVIPGNKYIEVDESLMPTGNKVPCQNSAFDFRQGRQIGKQDLDIAFTAPAQGASQLKKNETIIELSQDPIYFKYVQVYVPDSKDSIAIEPITSPTDAFNRPHLGLIEMEPHQKINTWAEVTLKKV